MHIMFRMCMPAIMALVIQTAFASENVQTGVTAVDAHRTGGLLHLIPEWRENVAIRNDIVPPPPPGPYMSTALTPMPGVYEPESGIEQNVGTEMANSPFFMPDMHWPDENRQPPRRWMPVQGEYQYVPEEVLEQQRQLDTGYTRSYPPIQQPRRAATARPVNHSQPVVERQPAYRGYSVFGNN
jgi:hypothetical protein